MKKIVLLFIAVTTIASSQLRVGLDASRKVEVSPSWGAEVETAAAMLGMSLPGKKEKTADGLSVSIGYDFMLLSLVGIGAELNMSGNSFDPDEELVTESASGSLIINPPDPTNQIFVYSSLKLPFGVPFARGVVRLGVAKPFADEYDPGLGYGFGLRIKAPLFPLGAEASYNIYNYKAEYDEEISLDIKETYMNISVTYSF